MPINDLKFFTNEPERDLYSRFATIMRSNTQFFDVLVGYFRTSGFFRMYPSLETVEKIRVLVGLNVDRFTLKIIDMYKGEVKYQAVSSSEGKTILSDSVENEFAASPPSEGIEKGVRVFIDWLKSGKIEMRIYTDAPIHAKLYIMRKDREKVPDNFGSVITGSSNFSESGLITNLEFNVELKDAVDVKFALERFEKIWARSIDIKDTYINAVEKRTWLRNDITPYQIYLKTLYEFFKEEINTDKELVDTLLPEGYLRLQYQIDAVTQARQKLEAYNGVFISDVVGLGKTYICAMLANSLNRAAYKLFICPPVLVDYWRSVLQDFDVGRFDVVSLGKLDRIIERGTAKYGYVFIDEAHRFRNSTTESYTKLHGICWGKKVVLISATPINNYTSDIENQLYLFQPKQGGIINGIKNLEGFFRRLNSELNQYKKGTQEYTAQLRKNSEVIRDKLLREVMIRRTRSEIVQYYLDDMKKQGLYFPKLGSPEPIVYEFDEKTEETFNETIRNIKRFKYSRYTPLLYLKDQKKYAQMLVSQRNMGGFMKGILVKRLESSFYAFKQTLSRFIESYELFIKMYESGIVLISKKVNVYDLLDSGDTRKLLKLIEDEDVMKFDSDEFTPLLIKDLKYDLNQLRYLLSLWSDIDTDPKLLQFRHDLTNNVKLKSSKIIVFTESMETAEYLYEMLRDIYNDRLVYFSGQSSSALRAEIEDSFNPQYYEKGNDKYDLLITTDVLAEGVNLHRANVVVNYDLPWNPTRIMQRVGRINRVGTTHDEIFVFNFFPTAQSSSQMPLEDRILEKLQAFHDTLGEDFKYLSDEEEVSSKKLFNDLNKDLDDETEESTNPELAYLGVIRQIRDNKPNVFEAIKRIPKKTRAGRLSKLVNGEATIAFIRKGALRTFFSTANSFTQQLSFMDAIKYIECDENEKGISIGKIYYDHYKANSSAFDDFLVYEEEVTSEKVMIGGNDAKVIRLLKAIKNAPQFTEDQEDKINKMISLWENGDIPAKVSKDIVKKMNTTTSTDVLELYYAIINIVPPIYFEEKKKYTARVDGDKQVVLSCYLKGE